MVKELLLFIVAYIAVIFATPIVLLLNIARKLYRKEPVSEYLLTSAIGFDQAGGSVLYAQENFTVSSFTHYLCRYRHNRYACTFERFIDAIFGEGHCERAYEWETKNDLADLQKFTKDV